MDQQLAQSEIGARAAGCRWPSAQPGLQRQLRRVGRLARHLAGRASLFLVLLLLQGAATAQEPQSETLSFPTVADVYVQSSAPDTNFDADPRVRADADVERIGYLRFTVTGVNGRPVEEARLRLEASSASDTGGTVHLITDHSWDETAVTYTSRPAVDGPGIYTAGSVADGDVVEFNLDGVIAGDGTYNLAIDSTSADGVTYHGSAATTGQPPLLILTVPSGPEPIVSIIAPADGATFSVGDEVALDGSATDAVDGDLDGSIMWSSDLQGALGAGSTITTVLIPGSHVVTASVTDSDGFTGSATIDVEVSSTATLEFSPIADTYVDARQPTTNHGSSTRIRADAHPERISYLRFAVTSVGGRPVETARLRVQASSASDTGGTVHLITDGTWDEAIVTYATRPPIDGAGLDTLGTVASGDVVEFDLDGAISGDGVYNIAIDSSSTDGVAYHTSAATAGDPPALVLTVASGSDDPAVSILQPANGSRTLVGEQVTFQGSATDAVDGDLSSAIAWTSDIQGALGTGAVLNVTLGEGRHTVTASVIDSDAFSGSAQISVHVTQNTAPLVAIIAPADGQSLGGQEVVLEGAASDAEDGDIGSSLSWTSDRDGALGSGGSITTTLSPGTHEITASAVDSGGIGGWAAVVIEVTASERLTFTPTADAYVDASKPTRNYGQSPDLRIDASPQRIGYLRFSVSGVGGRPVEQARLRLEGAGPSDTGGSIHVISDDSWDESTIVWDTRPAVDGSTLATLGPVASGDVVEFSLDGIVTADGIYSFAIDSGSSDGVTYVSSNSTGGAAPMLILDIVGDPAPHVDIVQPADGASFFVDDQVTFQGVASDGVDGDVSGSISWTSDIQGPLGTGEILSATLLEGTHSIDARATDSDGLSGASHIGLVIVPTPPGNTAPLVAITAPLPGATYPCCDDVPFAGSAVDIQDGDLSPSMTWTSSIDGPLGTGGSFNVPLSVGTHSITARVTDSSGLEGTATTTVIVTVPQLLEFIPIADTYVDEGNPTTNYGSSIELRVDASKERVSYLRFDVAGVGAGSVTHALLRLQVDSAHGSGSESGGTLHRISETSWEEGTITYEDRPTVDWAAVSSLDAVEQNEVVEIDLTDTVLADGLYSFALVNESSDAADYASRESSAPPQLVLTVEGSAAVGFEGASFGDAVDVPKNPATASKPESKLWYNDGIWWATLFTTEGVDGHRIHALDPTTQRWLDTGVAVDSRPDSRQDVLWDGGKLYVASRASDQNRLYRYSYDAGGPTYTLDAGFPVNISGGGTEAITIAKDSTGMLWIAYVCDQEVYVNRTTGGDTQWGSPFVVPVSKGTDVGSDDIAGVQALDGKIGVFWTNHITDKVYFAVRDDGESATDPAAWDLEIVSDVDHVADDHFNLKLGSDGRLFAVIKTSKPGKTTTRIGFLVRSASGTWSSLARVVRGEFNPTRAQCLLDETAGLVYVFYSLNEAGIYYKVSPIDDIDFPEGIGTPLIASPTTTDLNNPTTTKQRVDATTGIAVIASSPGTKRYWHNTMLMR